MFKYISLQQPTKYKSDNICFLEYLEKKKDRNKSAHSQDVTEEKADKEPANKGEWLTTMPSGERFLTRLDGTQLPVKDALVCIASDPMTKQVTTNAACDVYERYPWYIKC